MSDRAPPESDPVDTFLERLALLSLRVVELAMAGSDREKQQLDAGLRLLEAEAAGESDLLAYVGRLRALLRGDRATADEPFPIPGLYAVMWAEVQALLRQ